MSSYFLAFLLIFGLGHPKQDPVDPSKSAKLHSRLPCDGYGAPEDLVRIQVTYSPGASAREFVVSRYQDEKCEVDVKGKCLHRIKEGWRDVWSATNGEPSAKAMLPLSSCYTWGSTEAAQYILSGWYQEGPADPKMPWHQATIQQVSTAPEVYEFTDPKGGTARLEITR
ncbi:MAG TPA: hypothetical protein VK686_10815 [Bryobacteraceae bacterium]|nr:hypothetical protein [Bryobacteraceae bacterium]